MNHQTDGYTHLYHTLAACMTEKDFLRRIKLTAPDMAALLQTADTNRLAEALLAGTDERGRFSAKKVLALLQPQLDRFCEPPAEGWLQHAYNHVLGRLFPEKASGIPETPEQAAAHLLLEVLHHLRQARLGIVQLLRRPAQAAQLNDCQKCPDFFVVHCPVRFLSL